MSKNSKMWLSYAMTVLGAVAIVFADNPLVRAVAAALFVMDAAIINRMAGTVNAAQERELAAIKRELATLDDCKRRLAHETTEWQATLKLATDKLERQDALLRSQNDALKRAGIAMMPRVMGTTPPDGEVN